MLSPDEIQRLRTRLTEIEKLRKDLALEASQIRAQINTKMVCIHSKKVDYIWSDHRVLDIGGFDCPDCGMRDLWGRGVWAFPP